MSTDDELYERYVNGERHAGDELLLRYDNMLVAYINSLVGNLYDAEDLMIESFTVIFADKPKIKPGNFKAYLFRVTGQGDCLSYICKVVGFIHNSCVFGFVPIIAFNKSEPV